MPHQALSTELVHAIRTFLGRGGRSVFAAPFDVLLPARQDQPEDDVLTVVQPDLAVVCDQGKLRNSGCFGAPDWIIEILSPYTSRRDMIAKLELYQRHGVREYWMIDPGNCFIHEHLRGDDGRYPEPALLVGKAVARSMVCEGLEIGLEELSSAIPA
jgi:Uma2 family endonuclease